MSPTSFPPNVQSNESSSDKSDSSDESESSEIEENSETDRGLQDEMNTKPTVSVNASVVLSSTAAEKGNENESDGSQPQIPEKLEDPSNEGKLTLSGSQKPVATVSMYERRATTF